VPQVDALLTEVLERRGSDLHFIAGDPPRMRLYGDIAPLKPEKLAPEQVKQALYEIMPKAALERFEKKDGADFAYTLTDRGRFRVNVMRQLNGMGAVFRAIPSKALTLDELKLPESVRQMSRANNGLILVTGPTGSGKSTTLAAMVNYVNETNRGHIITVEDPIEFVHESKRCLVNQREVGPHTQSFAAALRAALREDPDVILVGELRDLETTQLAISAAETGHLVFATLHTNSAAKTIDRIIDIFPSGQQAQIRTMLSESLEGVVAQTLLPARDGKGRVAAVEVLVGVPALRNLIREDKTAQILSVIQTGANHGMISLDQHLRELVMQGRLSRPDAARYASNPSVFETPAPGTAAAGAGGATARPAGAAAPAGAPPGRPATPPGEPAKKPGLFGR